MNVVHGMAGEVGKEGRKEGKEGKAFDRHDRWREISPSSTVITSYAILDTKNQAP